MYFKDLKYSLIDENKRISNFDKHHVGAIPFELALSPSRLVGRDIRNNLTWIIYL
jgi:hypothetical protein